MINLALKAIGIIPGARHLISRIATNKFSSAAKHHRPHAYSLWPRGDQESRYLTWETVSNKEFFDLHLPPGKDSDIKKLPDVDEVVKLFERRDGQMIPGRSSVFFVFFAQWFTDGFFRSAPGSGERTTSTHNVDLAQLYGANEKITSILRSGKDGKLKSQIIKGEEYPPYLGTNKGKKWKVKEEFKGLPYIQNKHVMKKVILESVYNKNFHPLFATALERGNLTIGNISFNTLFLREHNSICKELKRKNPKWDDERLFHTARIINNIILMKLVVEDYVNHIAGSKIFIMDNSYAERQAWYRTPWIAGEFNLLYRWHSLVPDYFEVPRRGSAKEKEQKAFRKNNNLLVELGLGRIFDAASKQRAGKICLHNSPHFMTQSSGANWGAEKSLVQKGRTWSLRPFNDYREEFNLPRLTSFKQFTKDKELQKELEALYGHPDKVEFTVGLFAEASRNRRLTGELLTAMVAYDAFTQIYTNPLLTKDNFTEEHYTKAGMQRIEKTTSFQVLVNRNVKNAGKAVCNYD